MLTEANKATLVHGLQTNVDWGYPTEGQASGDFDPGTGMYVYRAGEPIQRKFPAMKIEFLPRSDVVVDGLAHVIKQVSGSIIYGYAELEPVIFTVYTHQICEGTSYKYHGKIIADAYIRRIELYVRRYWPKQLQAMEAYIKESIPFTVSDISSFLQGTETQGFEMTVHLTTTNKWTWNDDDAPATGVFEDAHIETSGAQENTQEYISVSGMMENIT